LDPEHHTVRERSSLPTDIPWPAAFTDTSPMIASSPALRLGAGAVVAKPAEKEHGPYNAEPPKTVKASRQLKKLSTTPPAAE